MATITTDTFLDNGTARTSNESWTLSVGAVLKVRTDTRWHVGSPASMTGTIGNVSANSTTGGGYYIDGTKVRWMAYDTGSGNVPAIGTTITQGGVSGYLLGVWADYVSAPTSVGAAMPATGFLKFREVTGGQFAVGALTGIGASATEADRVGWIEVVHNQSTNVTIYDFGLGFKAEGDWFDLGVTSGSVGQIIQFPTNGGGAATEVNGVQIETSPGSGVYEWWPAFSTAITNNGWRNTALATDLRGKAVQYISNGQLRIGSDGTNNIGYLPAAGCKIRTPNIFLRVAAGTGTNTAQNGASVSTNNVRIVSSAGGTVYIDKVMSNWAHTHTALSALTIKNTSLQHHFLLTNLLAPFTMENICLSHIDANAVSNNWATCGSGGTLNGLVCSIQDSYSVPISILVTSRNITISNLKIIKATPRSSAISAFFCYGKNITFNNLTLIGGGLNISQGFFTINNIDYCDRSVGETNSTAGQAAINIDGPGPNLIKGLTFGLNGTIANQHPYLEVITGGSNLNNTSFESFGSYASPLPTGSNSSFRPNRLFNSGGSYEFNIKFKRVFIGPVRNSFFINLNSTNVSEGFLVQNSGVIPQTSMLLPDIYGRDVNFRGCYLTTYQGTNPITYGSFFHDIFSTTTVGYLHFYCINPSASTSQYVTLSGGAAFSGGGRIILPTSSSYAIFESPYFIKGHTGFSSGLTISETSSGSYSAQYQINTGSGWNGTWKTINGTNLSAETINPTTGFKIKVKFQGNDTNASRSVWKYVIPTVTTSAAQSENLYPLSTATLAFTGLQAGSEVRCYSGIDPNTSVEIGGIESTAGSTFSFSHSSGGEAGYIMIFALGYQPLYIPYTFKTTDDSLLIQQVIDRNYTNPA